MGCIDEMHERKPRAGVKPAGAMAPLKWSGHIMSMNDQTGYRRIPADYDVSRWRHMLFVEIRASSRYRGLLKHVREVWERDGRPGYASGRDEGYSVTSYWAGMNSPTPVDFDGDYSHAIGAALGDLGLVQDGTSVKWAYDMFHIDVAGEFEYRDFRPATGFPQEKNRTITISVSPQISGITKYRGLSTDVFEGFEIVRSAQPNMLGDGDWNGLENAAIEAVKSSIAALKTEVQSDDAFKQIALGRGAGKAHRIKQLAMRLTGQATGTKLTKTDKILCDELGIDRPTGGKNNSIKQP